MEGSHYCLTRGHYSPLVQSPQMPKGPPWRSTVALDPEKGVAANLAPWVTWKWKWGAWGGGGAGVFSFSS